MTVKEVIYMAATELGILSEVQGYIENGRTNGQQDTERLLACFNIVENELALDYFPLYAEEKLISTTGKVLFLSFAQAVTRVLKVENERGERLPFTLFASYLKTQPDSLKISYYYAPKAKGIDDESDYDLQVSARMMAYGIAAEYTLAMGMYQEWAVWDKKYKAAITAAYRMQSAGRMNSRGWV